MATTPDPVHLAFEVADAIDRLPGQLTALFKKGASAEERLDSIGTACTKIRIGIEVVTNYIERNQPHLLDSHRQRIATILGNIERLAEREDSSKTRKGIDVLPMVAYRVAKWLREWAEELRSNQGQAPNSESSAPRGAAASAGKGGPTPAAITPTVDRPKVGVEPVSTENKWPPNDGLHLRPFEVAHRGIICVLTTTRYRLVKAIIESSDSVEFQTLSDDVWQGNDTEQHTIQSTLSQTKKSLRNAGLQDVADALYTKAARAHFDRKKLSAPTILTDF